MRSGYRLCLVYNLTLAKSRGKKGITAPTTGSAIAAIAKILRDGRQDEARQKLAVTLDHRYTQDGLTVDKLKGVDRVRAEVLFEAAVPGRLGRTPGPGHSLAVWVSRGR